MERIKVVAKNGIAGIGYQMVSMILQFLQRIVLLHYIGVELLGISSTISSMLSALSLTELGFQTAVVFHLYRPLKEKNYEMVNAIINILRVVYSLLSVLFFGLACFFIPALEAILNGIKIDSYIVMLYLLVSINISVTYALAYRRALLYADQKEYISKIYDTIFNILFFIIKIVIVIIFENFLGFWLVQIIQNFMANLFIAKFCGRKYPFLKKERLNRKLLVQIWGSVKNIFGGKLAGYIYGATDNLIISIKISPILVGYYTNYTLFTSAIKSAFSGIFDALTPIIGNLLVEDRSTHQEKIFQIYSEIRFLLANLVVIPWIIFNEFLIELLFGPQYIMRAIIPALLGMDMYIHIIYSECWEYINGAGLFQIDKYVSILGAAINIIISLLLSLEFGIEGIIGGTVISQIFFWIARSYVVYKMIFGLSIKRWGNYWLKNGIHILFTICITMGFIMAQNLLRNEKGVLILLLYGIGMEVLIVFIYVVVFRKNVKEIYMILKRGREKGMK